MNAEEYVQTRLDDQIAWHDRKSQSAKAWHVRLRVTEIVIASILPLLLGFADEFANTRVIAGALSVIVAVLAGMMGLYKLEENWVRYRTVAESLNRHRYRFVTGTPPYAAKDPFPALVENVENILASETERWAKVVTSEDGGQGSAGAA